MSLLRTLATVVFLGLFLGSFFFLMGWAVRSDQGRNNEERNRNHQERIEECVERGGEVKTDEHGWFNSCIGGEFK